MGKFRETWSWTRRGFTSSSTSVRSVSLEEGLRRTAQETA